MLLFLIAGLGGDDAHLHGFHTELAQTVRCNVLTFVDIKRPCAEIFDIDAIGNRLADRIMAEAPCGPIRIAGYSMGGVIAVETARRLRAAGREPKFVGLLDGAAVNPTEWRREFFRRLRRMGGNSVPRRAALTVVLMLDHVGLLSLSRLFVQIMRRTFGRRRTEFLSVQFLVDLWRITLERHTIDPYDSPVTLFLARQPRRALPPGDLGWAPYLPALRVESFSGNHWTMLQAPYSADNCAVLARSLSLSPPN